MKKIHSKFRILMALLCLSSSAFAQDYIVVHGNNMEPRFHKVENYDHLDIQNVFNHPLTQDGDTVYFPGVTFTLGDHYFLSKSLVLIGTGIHPDSALVAGAAVTTFTTPSTSQRYFNINTGAENTEIHGINFIGAAAIRLGNTAENGNVSGLKISRCRMYWLILRNNSTNTTVSQCVMYSFDNNDALNTLVTNSIIHEVSGGVQSTSVLNNFIIASTWASGGNIDALFENNIITLYSNNSNVNMNSQSRFYNNLWVRSSGQTISFGPNVFVNQDNILSNNIEQVFTSPAPTNPLSTFLYTADYSLNENSPFYDQYSTHATDGGEVGIYGGMFPWKDGILPFAPHWLELTVPGNATQNGLTGITIKGSAQND
jgi:hypothetical protein